ncbi:MAG: glycoside hydrolase family 2 TIM barrel-domain containing protein [Bacteroidales bacterium]
MRKRILTGLLIITLSGVIINPLSFGQVSEIEKQVQYLSGTGYNHTVTWDFYCTGGRKSSCWTTIEVPSCWEQQGFGTYNYGRDYNTYGREFNYADEKGIYRLKFIVPSEWKDKKVHIVFEGSMTDTEVKINGKAAGPVHQGSFYRFKYDITDKLYVADTNLLEVTVSKMSSNLSVNRAERYADYWIFGGIYRPVFLEVFPQEHIPHIAVAAKAEGSFLMQVYTTCLSSKRMIYTEITDSNGKIVGTNTRSAKPSDTLVTVNINVENPKQWTAETPNLYQVRVALCDQDKKVLFQTSERFGFRTIEVRPGDGIYINNTKVKMKGLNRHVFWPESGRTINRDIDLMDVKLIKEMNMNAVRCSHYPPDKSFLEICDSLGLYVLDELAGWQNAYDKEVGAILVKEMVMRDVNHPSVIFWSNGNEGGHNLELDNDFGLYDPSNRTVIHAHHRPGNAFNGIDCNHYENYEGVKKILEGQTIYMTTEFLHCQNDGGGGAGLYDYWELMRNSPLSAGGFLWAFLDEGIVRTDMNNIIDVNGVNAPDGVVGPHRQKEGSFYAIKEIFTPVYIQMAELPEDFNGTIPVENRYEFTNLNQCQFEWQLANFHTPFDNLPGFRTVAKDSIMGPNLKPGEEGHLTLNLPAGWKSSDALVLKAFDMTRNEILSWSWKIKDNKTRINQFFEFNNDRKIAAIETDTSVTINIEKFSITFDKNNGMLKKVVNSSGTPMSFTNGPVLAVGNSEIISLVSYPENSDYVLEAKYSGDLKTVRWKIYNSGLVELNYQYSITGEYDFSGVSFSFPEDYVMSAKWLGNGPFRVWKNRTAGGTFNVWQNAYNNTVTGYSPWYYPEFKGYFSNIVWMELNTVEGKIFMASPQNNLFVRLFDFYSLPGIVYHPKLPAGDISFLEHIPPTGTKMSKKINMHPEALGPQSFKNNIDSTFSRTIYFFFGILQK